MHPAPAVALREVAAAEPPGLVRPYRRLHPEQDLRADAAEAAWAATLATPGRTVLVADSAARSSGRRTSRGLANAARAGRPDLLVENVVVDVGARRAGVGRAPLAAARAHGEAAGCLDVQLSADDPEAFTCHEAAGLRPAARTYQRYLPAGRR